MAPSRYDWKIVDWDVKPQHNQPTIKIYEEQTWERTKTFLVAYDRLLLVRKMYAMNKIMTIEPFE